MKHTAISGLFYIAALYDGLLGLAFLIFGRAMFDAFAITAPNHIGYVQFPAALLVIFGLMFLAIARNPVGNRNLIAYGMLLKVSYCSVVFGHWFTTGIPNLWKWFAFADLAFLALFFQTHIKLRKA